MILTSRPPDSWRCCWPTPGSDKRCSRGGREDARARKPKTRTLAVSACASTGSQRHLFTYPYTKLPDQIETMVRLSLAAGLAGLAGVAGFQRRRRTATTVLQYKKTTRCAPSTRRAARCCVLTKDAPPASRRRAQGEPRLREQLPRAQGLGEPASAEVIAAFEVKLAEPAAAEAAA